MTPGKIITLNAENFKRLSAVSITPEGNVVVIGGDNAQGKTSVLDAIEAALGGETKSAMPVRKGAAKARVVVELSGVGLIVERRFTAEGGSTLIVKNADGQKQMSPQTILDKMYGTLTFDPLAFAREKAKVQAEILRGIVGIDFAADDAQREKLFSERTNVSRDAKALEARMVAMPKHDDAAAEEVSAGDIIEKQEKAIKANQANQRMRDELNGLKSGKASLQGTIEGLEGDIVDMENRLAAKKTALKAVVKDVENLEPQIKSLSDKCESLADEDITPFKQQLQGVETENRKVRENVAREEVVKQYKAKSVKAQELTDGIEAIDDKKRKATMEAKFPIAGLGLDLTGAVTFNDIPLDQASEAEKLKISVSIGIALNPALKILLIRDGSLLDDNSMKALADIAKEADCQVWLERVGKNDKTAVIIEDGHIAGVEPPKAEPEPETAPERADEAKPEPPPEEQPAKKPVKKQPKNPGELFG